MSAVVGLEVKSVLLDSDRMRRAIRRMAGEVVERNSGGRDVVLVGVVTRGVPLAEALAREIEQMEGHSPPLGQLDITLYRDDLSTIAPQPVVKASHVPGSIEDKILVLCDDVLFTGRTVRAALDALMDYGRPRAVELAVLVDRGHRELPIQADFVGERVRTRSSEVVRVAFEQTDGEEIVELLGVPAGGGSDT